jgi:hypothetical protein
VRLLEQASDHTGDVLCVNCMEVLDPAAPGVIFERAFVSGCRAGLCEGCHEMVRELVPVEVEVVLEPKGDGGEDG